MSGPDAPGHRSPLGVLEPLLTRLGGDALGRQLARGAFVAMVINILSILLVILSQIVLARGLGVEGYGIFAYVMAWVNLLVVPTLAGFETAQLRYVASYRATGEWDLLRGITGFAERVVLAAGTGCVLLAALGVWLLSDRLEPMLATTFYLGLLLVPLLALMRVRAASVRALGRVGPALAPDRLVRHGVLLAGVGGLVLLQPRLLDPATAALVSLIAAIAALGMVSYSHRRARPEPVRAAAPALRPREWLTTAIPLLFLATLAVVNSQAALLMLGWLGDTTEVGIFAVAVRLSSIVAFPSTIVTYVFAPTIARLYAKSEIAPLQRVALVAGWWVTTCAGMVALPLAVMPELFLALFGEDFATGTTALRILLLGTLVSATSGSVGALMSMTGLERQATFLIAGATMLNLACCVLLIPWLGLIGAAIAAAAATSCQNLLGVVIVWRQRRILSGLFATLSIRKG